MLQRISSMNEDVLLGVCCNVLYFILMETDSPEAEEQRSDVAPALTGGFPPDGLVPAQFPPYLLPESSAPRQDLGAHEKAASCL